ncbi:MAG: UTP--glucose-phosphate uridylyltransferase [Solirubrobacteraceae bacterium]|nr:UTP--glucose-phosphate uridylyltransferase [Solirubrobacteraceae bacterium]
MVNDDGLRAAKEKMRAEGVPDAAIATFEHYYRQLVAGESGMLPDDELEQLSDVPSYDDLPGDEDRGALDKTVVIKLNGGLGTSMGMEQAKSLLEVKEGRSFLDIIACQVLELRKRFDARLPLVLMNSFYTRDDTLEALGRHPELESDVPADFVQNKEPKLLVDDLTPVEWPDDPALEWCPPGHGDVYTALQTSGTLDALLEKGYEHAFLSNSDNLGAVLDPRVLSWFAAEELPFLMEVCEKTPADRKGGHPAVLKETGRLVLRETAQTPEEDLERFSDIDTWKYFNTNNLWVNLRALAAVLEENDGVLGLPMIVNRKTVDPGDKSTPEVFQLETAMGAAVGVFEGAKTLVVPRRRFAPVKTTSDLLVLRSDAYVLTDDCLVEPSPELADGLPLVELDPDHYKLLRDFDARFPAGPPSLVACRRLAVEGDVRFGRDVVCRGEVEIRHDGSDQRVIDDGTVLEG